MVDLDIEVLGDFSENIEPDDSFDLVTCELPCTTVTKQTCREIYECSPGGTVVATREHVISGKKISRFSWKDISTKSLWR